MISTSIPILAALHIFIASCSGCGCGCDANSPPSYYRNDYENLGIKYCNDYEIPPLEIQRPICPPPATVCKDLGIAAQTMYPSPPTCHGDSWIRRMPKCLRKRIRYPFCVSKINSYNQRMASYKRLQSPCGFNLQPLKSSGCGCGCGGY